MPTEPIQAGSSSSSDDLLPVDHAEVLIRRVLKRLNEYDRGKTPPLQAGAFFPTKRDDDGLSMNRRNTPEHPQFLTPEQLKNWHEVPEGIRQTCGVLAISTSIVRNSGLTVTPSPASTPGHVIIEELKWGDFEENEHNDQKRTQIMAWALQLAKQADMPILPGKPSLGGNAPSA
jgi:hypothetical protein